MHIIPASDLVDVYEAITGSREDAINRARQLQASTQGFACLALDSLVGSTVKEVFTIKSDDPCLPVLLAITELAEQQDLQILQPAHEMRLRLRKLAELQERMRSLLDNNFEHWNQAVAPEDAPDLKGSIMISRTNYRELRSVAKHIPEALRQLLVKSETRRVHVPVTGSRCDDVSAWMRRHETRIQRLRVFYLGLGYTNIEFLVRLGEEHFIQLVDRCVLPEGGYILSVDYGATFEVLAHSTAVSGVDVVVPPAPSSPLPGVDCFNVWTRCAGLVDWTTFVDFTNMAKFGEELGWGVHYYGPQSFLEQVQDWRPNGTASSEVPGYFLNDHAVVIGRHVRHWYGREPEGSYTWTSFKVLIQEKRKPERSRKEIGAKVVSAQPWHLDTAEMDSCWAWDMTGLPMATYMVGAANGGGPGFETYVGPDLSKAAYDSIEAAEQLGSQGLMARGRAALEVLTAEFDTHIGARQREAYEDTQLGLRLVDWLLAYLGCPDPEQDFAPWPMKIEPGWGRFAETWSDDRVNRVYTRIRETFEEPLPLKHQDPFICGARRLIGERCAPVNRRQFVTHQATV